MRRNGLWLPSAWSNLRTFALAGTLILASTQVSFARNDFNFREFRQQNSELSKQNARRNFRIERKELRARGAEAINPPPILHSVKTALQNAGVGNSVLNNTAQLNILKGRSRQISEQGQLVRLRSGLDLDLSSTNRNISLGKNLFADGATVDIAVGGKAKTVGAGSLVSAAEYVAVKQVLDGSGQQISIDRNGKATGGSLDLESVASGRNALRASALVIPEQVTTSGDFSRNAEFKLLGNLDNYGTVLALSGDGSRKDGAIRAVDINNYKGATIQSEVNLTLDASGTITNEGSIHSTGNLTLVAQGAIKNKGSVSAADNLSLQSSAVSNQGSIESLNGNVNLDGTSTAAMLVNNTKGTIRALNGDINVRSASYTGEFDSLVAGGDLFSRQLNLYTGMGTTDVKVKDVTGVVNQYGYAAHLSASTDLLTIGEVCLTGDPTIYNDSGTMHIAGDITVGERLVLVSAGDITSVDNIEIRATSPFQGFGIEMIAGASFVLDGGGGVGSGAGFSAITIPPLSPEGGVSLSGKKSKTGGGIVLGNNVLISTRASDLSADSNGAVVGLLAFAGKGDTAGRIDVSGTTIQTGGSGVGLNGSVFILAEATKGDVIKTGVIDTTGGTPPSFPLDPDRRGTVGIFTVNIVSSQKGQPVVYDEQGFRISSAFLTGEKLNKGGNLIITDTVAPVDIHASGSIDLHGGGLVSLQGQVEAASFAITAGSAEIVSNGRIENGANGSIASSLVTFLIAPNIGTETDPVVVDSPNVQSFGGNGTSNFVKVLGSGFVQIAGTSKGTIVFDAPDRDVFTLAFANILTGNSITINANSIGILEDISTNSLTLNAATGNITNISLPNLLTNELNVTTMGGNIGSSGTAFSAFGNASRLSATASGDIFLTTSNKVTFAELNSTGGQVSVNAFNSVTLSEVANAGGGVFAVTLDNGTLTVPGVLTGKDGVNLTHTNSKGKIVFATDAVVNTNSDSAGMGDINISVEPAGPPFPGNPANVETDITGTGTVTFTGAGVKAKSPVNTLHIPGTASILINNGGKSGNISLGGNVNMTADAPDVL